MQTSFSETDRKIFRAQCAMAEAVARLIGNNCEVVIHSLEDPEHSVVQVINGSISGRSVGAPLTNFALEMALNGRESDKKFFGPYYSMGVKGKQLRSVTSVIRGEDDRIIGLVCFNMNLSAPFYSIMEEYSGEAERKKETVYEIYPRTVQELIRYMLDEAVSFADSKEDVTAQERNTIAIHRMREQGVFHIKGAADIVASELGISRTSIYNYLRSIKDHPAQGV